MNTHVFISRPNVLQNYKRLTELFIKMTCIAQSHSLFIFLFIYLFIYLLCSNLTHTHTHTQVYLKWQRNNAEYKTQKHKKTHKAKQDSENTSVLTMTIELGLN